MLGGCGIGCGLLRRFELRGQVGKTSIVLEQLFDLGGGLVCPSLCGLFGV